MEIVEAIARARSWAQSPSIRPTPEVTRAVADALLKHIDSLTLVATGQLTHAYNGMCPDRIEGAEMRDEECPVCRLLDNLIP